MNALRAPSSQRPSSLAVLDWLRLARVYQKIERAAMEHLRPWGLSVPQFDILAHVGAAEGITQRDLARARLTTKGNLSQILDHMETSGLVCRIQEGHAKRVHLTEAGRQLFEAVVPAHETVISAQFTALTREEQAELLALLRRLDHALPLA